MQLAQPEPAMRGGWGIRADVPKVADTERHQAMPAAVAKAVGARDRVVDEEHGIVMAGGFIDHSGRLAEITMTDGTTKKSSYKSPHSYCLFEIFKIVDGKIREIESVFPTVTYGIPTPWKDQGGMQRK